LTKKVFLGKYNSLLNYGDELKENIKKSSRQIRTAKPVYSNIMYNQVTAMLPCILKQQSFQTCNIFFQEDVVIWNDTFFYFY